MASPITQPLAHPTAPTTGTAPRTVPLGRIERARTSVRFWEPLLVFAVTFAVLAIFTPRVTTYLNPTTGDEPFYLMTAISLLEDGDLNECNNYIERDELALYPSFYGFNPNGTAYVRFPANWRGWRGSPLPLPPHPAIISPASRQCASNYRTYPTKYNNPDGELYSKHGLGLSLMVLPAFGLGGRMLVVFFLNLLGAILAAQIFLLARESVAKIGAAVLTWIAFAFTVPLMPYSYLIFTEMPAALLTLYAFRRIRLWHNNLWQVIGIGACAAFLPWLHYRFAPLSVGLAVFYIYQFLKYRDEPVGKRIRDNAVLAGIVGVSAALLIALFMTRYGTPWPNGSDHAGINDVAGTMRGAAGLFLDQQWGLFVAAPIFILALVGLILMWVTPGIRRDLVWIGVVSLPYFLIIANYAQWWGEWCPPGRYLASVLPLFALPFAVTLDKIGGVAYRAIYGVLLFLSLSTMWGFIYQPQWMYNQPFTSNGLAGKSELLTKGFDTMAVSLRMPFLRDIDLTEFLPSFVYPYFAYIRGDTFGDAAAADAWRASWLPLAVITFVIFVSLLLARASSTRRNRPSGAPPNGSATDATPAHGYEATPGQFETATLPTQNTVISGPDTAPVSAYQLQACHSERSEESRSLRMILQDGILCFAQWWVLHVVYSEALNKVGRLWPGSLTGPGRWRTGFSASLRMTTSWLDRGWILILARCSTQNDNFLHGWRLSDVPAGKSPILITGESCAGTADLGKMGMVHISGRPFGLPGAILKN